MITVELHFDPRLARLARRARLQRRLSGPTSVEDVAEAAGVPHCEIAAVRGAAGLDTVLAGGEDLEFEGVTRADPGDGRFLCDNHLGKLARLLRTCGFDTAWGGNWSEPEVARRGLNEGRIVLSGSRALLKRKVLERAMLVTSDDPDTQAADVIGRYGLVERVRLFGRCPLCNGDVGPVDKADVAARIPPRTAAWLDTYYLCDGCDQLFWEGTHVTALRPRIAAILDRARKEPS